MSTSLIGVSSILACWLWMTCRGAAAYHLFPLWLWWVCLDFSELVPLVAPSVGQHGVRLASVLFLFAVRGLLRVEGLDELGR